ncbi:20S proteasome subunit beta 1 [Nematocida minor]|uniref:20S proteasome subunit beta 1 n=1 Tax=Nematocida minor TaxID=1912983 RepID=UPI0022210945|nr:20S proteasome subunit beta 1 [Nematocida minor]KAI5189635.1 20S proteasome subunit beta 1 [Nematocida minor]
MLRVEEDLHESMREQQAASLGTTIMAVKFKDGVLLGADTRTSMGTYVSNRVSRKITKLIDNVYTCRSGSAADTQAISDYVQKIMLTGIHCHGQKPLVKDVAVALKKIVWDATDKNITAGFIVAGVDETGGHVFSVPLGGALIEQNWSIAGSGSIYITGLGDSQYKEDMTKEEAVEFVRKMVSHAIYRDNSSGGCVRMLVITEAGTEEITVLGDEVSV